MICDRCLFLFIYLLDIFLLPACAQVSVEECQNIAKQLKGRPKKCLALSPKTVEQWICPPKTAEYGAEYTVSIKETITIGNNDRKYKK
jgi:hypothetical protein